MLRDKSFYLRSLVAIMLVGSLFGLAAISRVSAAPASRPMADDTLPTDTPTPTETPTNTVTPSATSTFILTPTNTQTSTITETPTIAPTSSITPTFTATPTAPNHLVISKFRTVGPLGLSDEFVELYNPTGAAVNIGYWMIRNSSSCGSIVQTLATIYYGTILQPGQHYLLAASGSSSITIADQIFSPGIANDGDKCILGLDVGSTTTKAVLMRQSDDAILGKVYLYTHGNPVKAAKECYSELLKQIPQKINIIGLILF